MSEAKAKEIRLSSKGLAQLPANCYENDFTLIAGGQAHHCPCWAADFISPRISRLRSADATIREFRIEVNDCSDAIESLLSFREGIGLEIEVNDSTCDIYLAIATELWNVELFDLICETRGCDFEKVIAELRLVEASSCGISGFESLVERCSCSISEVPRSSLSKMSVDLLHSILSHDSLKLPSKDWLYEFVKAQLTRHDCYSTLLELIRYEYLSIDSICDFVRLISESFDLLTYPIWLSLIRRLTLSVSPNQINDRVNQVFVASEGGELNGIFSFLTRECGGNIHDRGIVAVSASSQHYSDYPVQVIFDFKTKFSGFATKNEDNSWICIEFKQHRIKPTHYSIRTRADSDTQHPRTWVLEGVGDAGDWFPLDCQTSNSELSGPNCVRTFSIGSPREVRSVRLRQTGPNSSNCNHLILKSIELFGELIDLPSSVQ
jgi:hypothetical protein